MSQLILESENESNLKLMQELAEKLNIHCRLVLMRTKSESTQHNETNVQPEGEKALQLMEKYQLLGCMEDDDKLSENYKQHLWGNG
jgi:hypothetical protein